MPIQGPQVHSRILAPQDTKVESVPFSINFISTCLDPGETTRLTLCAIFLPFKIAAAFIKSS